MFCSKCGKQIEDDSAFCMFCGNQITPMIQNVKVIPEPEAVSSRTSYVGKVFRCPNCGGTVDSFSLNCPSCGIELHRTETAVSTRQFIKELTIFCIKPH